MAILAFQKPDKVVMLEANDHFGKFEFRPLEPGFGVTIGNALRRILLSSLEGFAINTVRIAGVEHEFSSVPGVKEDVTNIILNLKQVRFKQVVEEFENEKVSITVENSTEFKAGDVVGVREKAKSLEVIEAALAGFNHSKYPWLEWDENAKCGKFLHRPDRADIPENIKEQLIVELYSKQ